MRGYLGTSLGDHTELQQTVLKGASLADEPIALRLEGFNWTASCPSPTPVAEQGITVLPDRL